MHLMRQEGRGVIVYLRQEGRNIGLMEKLKAYNLQDMGHDTVTANLLLNHPADGRTYDAARAILKDLNVTSMRLLTNNPDKIRQIEDDDDGNLRVVSHVPMVPKWWIKPESAKTNGAQQTPDTTVSTSNNGSVDISTHIPFLRHVNPSSQVMSEADKVSCH